WYRVPFALWVLAGDVQRRSRNGVIDVRVGYPPSLARFLGIRMNDSVIPVPDAFATRLPHGLPQLHLDASAEMCLVTTAFPWRRTGQHRDRGVFVPVRQSGDVVDKSIDAMCLEFPHIPFVEDQVQLVGPESQCRRDPIQCPQ